MAGRRCPGPSCPTILTNGERYCTSHAADYEARRGTPKERGYDSAHSGQRWAIQARIERGEIVRCWRCGVQLTRRARDLGHDDHDRYRSGPQADPNSGRSEVRGYTLTALPSEGYDGEVPAAWSMASWRWATVGEYCRLMAKIESGAPAAYIGQLTATGTRSASRRLGSRRTGGRSRPTRSLLGGPSLRLSLQGGRLLEDAYTQRLRALHETFVALHRRGDGTWPPS